MTISSRTPEGDPFACRVCGSVDRVEPSALTGDAVCPRCGGYVSRLLSRFDNLFPGQPGPIDLDTPLTNLMHGDSLDIVELVMGLEEEFGVTPDPDELSQCTTFGDLVRYLSGQGDAEQSF